MIAIQEDLNAARLSFAEIAAKHEVPLDWVDSVANEMAEHYDESMDGDFDSAMASAGYGTDEDYGCYGADDYWGGQGNARNSPRESSTSRLQLSKVVTSFLTKSV